MWTHSLLWILPIYFLVKCYFDGMFYWFVAIFRFWDISKGKQLLSSYDSLESDSQWTTESCPIGFGVSLFILMMMQFFNECYLLLFCCYNYVNNWFPCIALHCSWFVLDFSSFCLSLLSFIMTWTIFDECLFVYWIYAFYPCFIRSWEFGPKELMVLILMPLILINPAHWWVFCSNGWMDGLIDWLIDR